MAGNAGWDAPRLRSTPINISQKTYWWSGGSKRGEGTSSVFISEYERQREIKVDLFIFSYQPLVLCSMPSPESTPCFVRLWPALFFVCLFVFLFVCLFVINVTFRPNHILLLFFLTRSVFINHNNNNNNNNNKMQWKKNLCIPGRTG